MVESSQARSMRLHLRGSKSKLSTTSDADVVLNTVENNVPSGNNAPAKGSKPFSPKALYSCFQSSSKPSINKSNTENTSKQLSHRSMRYSVTPDEEESESMQIIMLENEDGMMAAASDPVKGDGRLSPTSSISTEKDRLMSGSSNESDEVCVTHLAGDDKKGSKLGGLFKSGRKGSGGNSDSTNNKNGGSDDNSNKDSSGNSSNSNNGEDKSDSQDKGDGSSGDNNQDNPNSGPFDPITYFGTERITFAQQSTLPLHLGIESTAPTTHPTWTPASGQSFSVRVGPNYAKTGKKEPSLENLYEVYCVRYFRSPCRTVGGATRIMPLPEMMEHFCGVQKGEEQVENETETKNDSEAQHGMTEQQVLNGGNSSHPELKGTKIPDVLVVHFMLPYEPPNMFKQKDDGPGGECVYYLRPSQRFLDEVSGKIVITPATRLFVRWCNECQSNVEMRSRFKCMALVRDMEKHNLGLLKTYNGKPVLITESGRVCSGYHGDVRYLEMTANVHYWAFIAKKGFVSLIPKFKNMQMEVGFTIEGRTDNELPECMLGSTVLSYINEETGPMITSEMQAPVHEHQA